jgi:hypothetical protein
MKKKIVSSALQFGQISLQLSNSLTILCCIHARLSQILVTSVSSIKIYLSQLLEIEEKHPCSLERERAKEEIKLISGGL